MLLKLTLRNYLVTKFCKYLKDTFKMEEKKHQRSWHPSFKKYTEFIVNHNSYEDLFYERGKDGNVKWVVTGKSEKGQKRRAWWDEQCKKHGIKIEAGCYAKIALLVHPTKLHTCQICGKELSVEYIYPNSRTLLAINKHFNIAFDPFTRDIFEIIEEIAQDSVAIDKLKKIFKIDEDLKLNKISLKKYIKEHIVESSAKGLLSPGVMSNSPDRFDGYHSDGNCCRSKSDKGRHKSNLQRYGQDRRVYENWADGDWKMADRLMSEFRKHGMSADHIGPISLGFCHRPKFHPLTKAENSAKNNRMSLSDVKVLLEDEKKEQIVSWHSKFIWDELKSKIQTDKDAVRLSDLMRKNLHYVLTIFSMVDEAGHRTFLEEFLNPQYSFFDYSFEGFNPKTGKYKKAIPKKLTGKNQQNNIQRYKRIAFEKLEEYKNVNNRKVNKWKSKEVDLSLKKVLKKLAENDYENAKLELDNTLMMLAEIANKNW